MNFTILIAGNMWGQEWNNIYDILQPYKNRSSVDITPAMIRQVMKPHRLHFPIGSGFPLSHYLNGPLPYVRRHITVNKTFHSSGRCRSSVTDHLGGSLLIDNAPMSDAI